MSLADLRRDYNLTGLRRRDLASDPISQFNSWMEAARGARTSGRLRRFFVRLYKSLFMANAPAAETDVNAMTLATADKQGRPSARIVLLKGVDSQGFTFFTNYESRKGQELSENSAASLVFYWPDLERQVCIAGNVKRISRADSEAYFSNRPRGSQLAAWASKQGQVVPDRQFLEAEWKELESKFHSQSIPTPPYWGGYLLVPSRIEFWQGRPNRLHDRFRYTLQQTGNWLIERLSP